MTQPRLRALWKNTPHFPLFAKNLVLLPAELGPTLDHTFHPEEPAIVLQANNSQMDLFNEHQATQNSNTTCNNSRPFLIHP